MELYGSDLNKLPLGLTFDDVLLIPRFSTITLEEIDVSTRLTRGIKLDIPIVSSPMDTVTGERMVLELGRLGGVGVLPRNMDIGLMISIISKAKEEEVPVGIAVGPFDDDIVSKVYSAGADFIVVDAAHGHSRNVVEAVKRYKRNTDMEIIAGNIVTEEGAEALISAGADALRVGLGCGHACTTREITGVGVPQLTAIKWVYRVASDYEVPLIADGGIEKPADLVKALAAGADTVMLGYLLAGTDEAPGSIIRIQSKEYKYYRGMGSKAAITNGSRRYGEFKKVPEGIEGYIEYRGSLRHVVEWLIGGLKQAMGYLGARDLSELRSRARFIMITNRGRIESRARGLLPIGELNEYRSRELAIT